MKFIDLAAQQVRIKAQIDANIQAVLAHGQYVMGPEITELEAQLAQFVGVKHVVTCASGTDALLMAMMALGIGAGDEVITTPFTFIATGEMIALLGAKPVFVDIDPVTFNIDPALIEAAITDKTKAIMPVSLYGQCADMQGINEIAQQYNLPVIEDGAQSLGATQHGRQSGALSTIGCTSFFPSKPLGAYGDGGACFTDDDALAKSLREIRIHGQDRRYHHTKIGICGRMDTLQAAVLLPKLAIFADEVEKRGAIGAAYSERLRGLVATPAIMPGNTHVYAQYTIRVQNRDQLVDFLTQQGVPTAVHYPIPLHLQPVFKYLGFAEGAFPNAELAGQQVLSLPMDAYVDERKLQTVTEAIRAFTSQASELPA